MILDLLKANREKFYQMLIGEYKHSIDGKGRVAIPAKLRRDLDNGVVVTIGQDNCLVVYPKDEWVRYAQKISNLSFNQSVPRAFSRLMLGGAHDAEFDAQGRILIADNLRAYAALKEKVVIVGLYNRLELWDENRWEIYKKQTEKDADKIAEELGPLSS